MPEKNLNEWLKCLESLHPSAIDLGLERVKKVGERLQIISFNCPVILVGGTNGKGSTVAMLSAIYQTAGYQVAAYTSPHLLHFTERLLIQGKPLTENEWCTAFEVVEKARGEIRLTYFEFTTLAAFWLIQSRADIEVAILEIGMGGRLDAVNIVEPDLSIVTSIALDHQAYLGPDRNSIGHEKAGIFRSGKPALCGDPDPPKTILETAHKLNTLFICQGKDFFYEKEANRKSWSWKKGKETWQDLPVPSLPLQNASTVLAAISLLQSTLPVSQVDIKKALSTVQLAGRMQRISAPILTIVDVAHNPHASALLAENLKTFSPAPQNWHAVVGILKDKDIKETLSPLLPVINQWYPCTLKGERGSSAEGLIQHLKEAGINPVTGFENPTLAYQKALSEANEKDGIIVFGSFYTVAEILALNQ